MWKLFTSLALLVVATNLAAADEGKKARIGFLSWWPPTSLGLADEFRAALRPLGWVEGRNIEIEVHFTDGDRARTQAVAREFIETGVDVIVAQTTPAIHIAKEATQTIPIVMAPVADPIATGLVKSVSRPEGNLTGLSAFTPDLAGKRLGLLHEIRPDLRSVAFLGSRNDPNDATFLRATQLAAERIGMTLSVQRIDGPEAIDQALFDTMKRDGVEAVVVQSIFAGHQDEIVRLAMKSDLPVVTDYVEFAEAGALLTFGVDRAAQMRRAAYYVDRILKGAKPGDLPIEQPTQFEFVINARTAKQLGWTIPQISLMQADRVIE
jgi:putative ABC transport system substrate-binding protein